MTDTITFQFASSTDKAEATLTVAVLTGVSRALYRAAGPAAEEMWGKALELANDVPPADGPTGPTLVYGMGGR